MLGEKMQGHRIFSSTGRASRRATGRQTPTLVADAGCKKHAADPEPTVCAGRFDHNKFLGADPPMLQFATRRPIEIF